MNWITGLMNAVEYIENHLEDELDYDKVAREANCSSFYFQRLFSMLTGFTVGEYIRKRRLSVAAAELLEGKSKVIDVAMKYGYDNPESFSRAFRAYHGCKPSEVKNNQINLKFFSRISTRLTIDGGLDMDYRIEKLDAFAVIEKVKQFSTKDGVNLTEIPAFWQESWKDGTNTTLCNLTGGETCLKGNLLGICYEEEEDKNFPYSIAMPCEMGLKAPKGFRVNVIKAHTWIVFKAVGPLPHSIQNKWKEIYTQFFPTSEYQPTGEVDFEAYPNNEGIAPEKQVNEIWISVEKK